MALANFFEKNALAAHQLLHGIDPAVLETVLSGEVVGLTLDAAAVESPEARVSAELTVDLLARFYPQMRVLGVGQATGADFLETLRGRARAINSDVELAGREADHVVVLGSEAVETNAQTTVYIGSDAWRIRLSRSGPVGSGATGNPFAAAAAACIGVANLFRAVMEDYLPGSRLDDRLDVSIVDWGAPYEGPVSDLDATVIDLTETLLGGVGAIGNAVVWTLARVPHLEGTLRLIDPETADLSNLQRYVLTDQGSVGTRKVELAATTLRRSQATLEVTEHPLRWGEYLHERDNWTIPRIVTAFDSVDDRVRAQGALPRSLLNAWTQLGDLGVSRHTAFGEVPCAACLYTPRPGGKSEAERVSNDLGFEGDPPEIRHLLYTAEPVSDDFVRRVAENLGQTEPDQLDVLMKLAGRPLREFHNAAVCGGVMLNLGVLPGAHHVEAPMAFQSVLAGVMLAAEIVFDAHRERLGVTSRAPIRTVLDLLRPVPKHPHPPLSRRPSCICSDRDYLVAYREKYSLVQRTVASHA